MSPKIRALGARALKIFGGGAFLFAVTTYALFWSSYAIWKPCELSPSGCNFLDCNIDTDGDGIPDLEEQIPGLDGYVTSPNDPDTDRDGKWDGLDWCPLDDAATDAPAAPVNAPEPEPEPEKAPSPSEDSPDTGLPDAGTDSPDAGPGDDDWGEWDQFEEIQEAKVDEPEVVDLVIAPDNVAPNSCQSGAVKPIWDTDRDGIPDHEENAEGADGYITRADEADTDGDQVPDIKDRCPLPQDDGSADEPVDTNSDGEPDACASGRPLKPMWYERSTIAEKYYCWIANLASGRAGTAEKYQGMPLRQLVAISLYETLILIFLSLLLAMALAFPVVAALHTYRRRKLLVQGFDMTFAFLAVPIVLVGYVLGALVNSVDFNVFVTFDQGPRLQCTDRDSILYGKIFTTWTCGANYFKHLLLPAIVLALGDGNLGHFVRDMSHNLEEVAGKAFMRYAQARGISRWRMATRYLLKNVAVPALTFLQYRIVFLLSGVLVVEVMFDRKGLGRLMINAINEDYDIPTFLACVLTFLVLVFVVQTITRLLQVAIDRRLA